MAGLMSITGEPGHGPMRVGIPIVDLCAGIFAAQGALMALLQRERTGTGQWVQTSLLQAQTFLLDFQAARWLIDKEVPAQARQKKIKGVKRKQKGSGLALPHGRMTCLLCCIARPDPAFFSMLYF